MTNKPSTNPLSSSLLAAFEERKKTSAEKASEKIAQEKAAKERLIENLLQPYRQTFNAFDKEQDRLAYNFLIRLQNKIFNYDHHEYQQLDFGQGKGLQEVLLPKVTKRGAPLFHALKHTHGFLSFISWVCFYNGFEKMCTATSICERLGWVLRYGKDKAEVQKDLRSMASSPKFAHSLTTPLGYVNQRTKRSLEARIIKKTAFRSKKRSTTRKVKREAAKVERMIESSKVQMDLIKRDVFVFQYDTVKKR